MKNDWKRIWEKRNIDDSDFANKSVNEIFVELKRCNGFDTQGGKISADELVHQYERTKQLLFRDGDYENSSVFELGCGSGANLYLFENDGFTCGGLDYSKNLIDIAKKVLRSKDILCMDAAECPITPSYDAVFSNSVFCYFESTEYAFEVLLRMVGKAKHSVGLIDIHDADTYDDYISFRRRTIEDYDKRYASLPKLFFKKVQFEEFARNNKLEIVFVESEVNGYWNNPYVFNCFMYKK